MARGWRSWNFLKVKKSFLSPFFSPFCLLARGWRSWNLYGNNVNQTLIESIMDGMVKKQNYGSAPTSLCDLGYW